MVPQIGPGGLATAGAAFADLGRLVFGWRPPCPSEFSQAAVASSASSSPGQPQRAPEDAEEERGKAQQAKANAALSKGRSKLVVADFVS